MSWDSIVCGGASIVLEIAKGETIQRPCRYLFNYRENISQLKKELQILRNKKTEIEVRLDEASTKFAEDPLPPVTDWLKEVDAFTRSEEEDKFGREEERANRKCFMGFCPKNFKMRFKVSRKAVKKREACLELLEKGNFEKVSHLLRRQYMGMKGYVELESRTLVLEAIMDVLSSRNVSLIGVHGMAGVGKSTFLEKVRSTVEGDRQLDFKVVQADVEHCVDLKKIQGAIAEGLGFNLNEEYIQERARRLYKRIKGEKKLLVILDNIDAISIDLHELGIPQGDDHDGSYKILMTSWNKMELTKRKVADDNIFQLQFLDDSEAFKFFKEEVGDEAINKNPHLEDVSHEVSERCKGLPLLLKLVGSELRDQEPHAWNDYLEWLKRFAGMEDTENVVFSTMELSYNKLSEEEKKLFLLCGRLAHNSVFSVLDLLKYIVGLRMFEGKTIKDVRNRLHTLIDKLKQSSFLQETKYHLTNQTPLQMHYFYQRYAISKSKQQNVLVFTESDTPPAMEEWSTCSAISLLYCEFPRELLVQAECPKLEVFTLANVNSCPDTIPEDFFQGMTNLKVLDLTAMHSSSLPCSIKYLENLTTLCLEQCVLEDTAIIGELRKLQVLSLAGSEIVRLPEEIRQLTGLLLLDLSDCRKLQVIPRSIISCLRQLEHLDMVNSFLEWDGEGPDSQGSNATIAELKDLSNLTTLYIHVKDAKIIPKDLFPDKLERFGILIGEGWDWDGMNETQGTLMKLKLNTPISSVEGIEALLGKTENLYLQDLVGNEHVVYQLDERGFPMLKHLCLKNCPEIKYVARMDCRHDFKLLETLFLFDLNKLAKICDGVLMDDSCWKLRKLQVRNCGKLRNLFSFSMVNKLVRLEEIEVADCGGMEGIIAAETEHNRANHDHAPINLAKLYKLTLQQLSRFKSFCFKAKAPSGSNEITPESDLEEPVPLFDDKVVAYSNLEELTLSNIKVENFSSYCMERLTILVVEGCPNLKYLFRTCMVGSHTQLKSLEIYHCKSIEEIIVSREGEEMVEKMFPKLTLLKLEGLPELKWFCASGFIQCPSLKQLLVDDCPKMMTFRCTNVPDETFFDERVAFPNLEELRICRMPNLKLIWKNECAADSFRKLRTLEVTFAENLSEIFPFNELKRFQNLEEFTIRSCDKLKSLFPISTAKILKKLKIFEIVDCLLLEEIVARDKGVEEEHKLIFPKLKSLHLEILPELTTFYHGTQHLACPDLEKLYVCHCHKLPTFSFADHSLQATHQAVGQVNHQTALFSFRKVVSKVVNLSLNSEHAAIICECQFSAISFNKIKILHLTCYHDHASAFFPYDLLERFHNIEQFHVEYCDFEKLFPREEKCLELQESRHVTMTQIFNNIIVLDIWACDRLTNLVTTSTAKSMSHLTELRVGECMNLIQILLADDDDEHDQIVFAKLEKLTLQNLQKLTSFCWGNCTIEFPSLEELILHMCQKMENFCHGRLSTPKLQIYQDEKGLHCFMGDLNVTIRSRMQNNNLYKNEALLKPKMDSVWSLVTKFNLDQ